MSRLVGSDGFFLREKSTKAPDGMNYPYGGFKKAFLAYPFS
jgi:hypothetical protein